MGKWSEIALSLLDLPKASLVEKACKKILVDPKSLRALCLSAQRSPKDCSYEWFEAEHIPADVKPATEEVRSLFEQVLAHRAKGGSLFIPAAGITGPGARMVSKMDQAQEVRKAYTGHLFRRPGGSPWFLLYGSVFDASVIQSMKLETPNHWAAGGPHLHLIHSLWCRQDPMSLIEAVTDGAKLKCRREHVRFWDPEWGEPFQQLWHPDVRR